MIHCPVCGAVNDNLALTCGTCKGYVQGRADALDLFAVSWGLLESPRRTVRKVALARHKNYTVILSALFGIALGLGGLWWTTTPRASADPLLAAAVILLGGPLAGVITVSAMALGALLLTGSPVKRFPNAFAVTAYAAVPIVFSLVLVFPVELAVFGLDFFRANPHPMVISPIAYMVLIGLDGLAVLWSAVLFAFGVEVTTGVSRLRALIVVVLLFLPFVAGMVALGSV